MKPQGGKSRKTKICCGVLVLLLLGAAAAAIMYGVTIGALGQMREEKNKGVTVTVSQLSAKPSPTLVKRADSKSAFTLQQAPQSKHGESWSMIDGLVLKLYGVRIASNSGERRDYIIDWSTNPKNISIGGNVETVPVTDDARFDNITDPFAKQFVGLDVVTLAPYDLKAFCRTENYIVYTTSTGFKKVNATGTLTLPNDYDYFTISSPRTNNDGKIYYNNFYPFTLSSNTTSLTSLIDNSYSVKCFDGSDFTSSEMYMDLLNLNVFVNIGSNLTLTPETYVVSTNQLAISGTNIDFSAAQIVTFAYLSNGKIFATAPARTTISNPINGLFNFIYNNDDTISMNDGSPYGKEYRNLKDRLVQGFKRPSGSELFQTTMSDDADCGITLTDYNSQNPARSCLGSGNTVIHYWKKLGRG